MSRDVRIFVRVVVVVVVLQLGLEALASSLYQVPRAGRTYVKDTNFTDRLSPVADKNTRPLKTKHVLSIRMLPLWAVSLSARAAIGNKAVSLSALFQSHDG